jgi:hypothetical protein
MAVRRRKKKTEGAPTKPLRPLVEVDDDEPTVEAEVPQYRMAPEARDPAPALPPVEAEPQQVITFHGCIKLEGENSWRHVVLPLAGTMAELLELGAQLGKPNMRLHVMREVERAMARTGARRVK